MRVTFVAGQDISAGFGIMCSFLAPNFLDVASAVDEALRVTRDRGDTISGALGEGVTSLRQVDDDAAAGFFHLTNAKLSCHAGYKRARTTIWPLDWFKPGRSSRIREEKT